jgi:glycosyltransferase involved in cell wall biosynthesis
MPVFNGEHYLPRSLKSLLNQTYGNFELIISDNASTDQTEEICNEIAKRDRRVRYIRNPVNIGSIPNFKLSLERAEGQYFMWAACDDFWEPSFVEKMVKMLDEHPSCIMAFSGFNHVDINGAVFRTYPNIYNIEETQKKEGSKSATLDSLPKYLYQNIRDGKTNLFYAMMRRKEVLTINPLGKWGGFGWGFDLLVPAEILKYGNVCIAREHLWLKTERPGSEGAPPKGLNNSIIQSIVGILNTFYIYNKYVFAYWGLLNRDSPISIARSSIIKYIIFEITRTNTAYLRQVAISALLRLKFFF